ncbi:OCTN [Mytilus edulis]|uniref:SLC22A4_5 n=1 Tax=Mytilus edulis TaxID=6550 RepID=A0A8S3VQ22_MYTED|nr:OCTN [Mytilus edulis]
MKFDDILTQIGSFGPYQKRNYVLLMIGWILTGPFMGLSVFINGIPEHRCQIWPRLRRRGQGSVHQRLIDEYIGMEWVGPSRRTFVGLVIALIGPVGSLFYILISYYVRQWNWIIIALTLPIGLFLALWWMVASMVFYGLSLNTGMLYGDYYINFLLSILMEFPGHALPIFMIDRIDLQPLTTALAMIGKLFSTAAFATIYVISAEVFPTAIRNAGMGSSSCWARVGGMISPFIADTVCTLYEH